MTDHLTEQDYAAIYNHLARAELGAPPPVVYGSRRDRQQCRCGHARIGHEHHRPGSDCGACQCDLFRSARRHTTRQALRGAWAVCYPLLAATGTLTLLDWIGHATGWMR